ncbi:hypothetical protein VTO42DRAFT_6367 [Malbranchea cinnamomea]
MIWLSQPPGLPPCERLAGITQGKREKEDRVLAHQVGHHVPSLETDEKSKISRCLLQSNARVETALGHKEIRDAKKGKGKRSHRQDTGEHEVSRASTSVRRRQQPRGIPTSQPTLEINPTALLNCSTFSP